MPDPTGGVGTAIIAGGNLLSAGLSYKGAKDARKDARAADAEAMAFMQKRYDDWKSLYGGVEENLAKHYNSLTPAYYSVRGVEEFNKTKEEALTKIRENFAQRGIDPDSALAASTFANVELEAAKQKSQIRTEARDKVIEAKKSFLELGIQRDPTNDMQKFLADKAVEASRAASSAGEAAGTAIGSAISSTTKALADYSEGN